MKRLKDICKGIVDLATLKAPEQEISALVFDSRKVTAGSLFFAVRGTLVDGHRFIDQAIASGAVAIVCEEIPEIQNLDITYIKVADAAAALGFAAANFYDHPSKKLKLVGVTGTNGKTTIATLLFQLFRDLGYKCGLLSTVENRINNEIIPATHTTPDPIALNQLLNEMIVLGCDYAFMEVSSHAVVQHRISGLEFVGGIFSNLSHDHLDFHKTFAEYLKAKKRFFDELPNTAFALVNLDDKNGLVMLQNTKAHQKTYALKSMADFKAKIIENQFGGLLLNIDNREVWFKLVGSFNAYNLLSVYAAAMLLEQDKEKVLTVLSRLSGAEGRFDYLISSKKVIGIIDYAHTPDAVQNVLSTIKDIRKGNEQVITVIGCGGDRDKTKRPIMASVACDWSDKVILTSDNPRSEEPDQIIRDMEAGISPDQHRKAFAIADRKEAIKAACHLAQPDDIILLAGKGHEKYQEIKGVKYPFDDKQILAEQFKLMS
ncbi:MAG: UDP-N-acetylmuramoyl-L-alanyl-D-glutamate--2,6-diaminopimelate ligase [Sphingobacteriaceae bacterium]|nr:MAG: UDP-N-acetylmuramoyl-L-alanyl-D-glutamate--2,6-diaminopimelate ligase [Sphingobacteriaceae bacterium]